MQIVYTGTANASGNVTVTINDVQSGLLRVIAQISVECITAFRPGAACVIRRNGRFVTSTIIASGDTAYKEPFLQQTNTDTITCDFTGFTNKDNVAVTVFCWQGPWTANPPTSFVV